MSNKYEFVTDINPTKETWKIKVRVIRLFNMPNYNNSASVGSIELVLLDEKDGRIQATVKQGLVCKFNKALIEGRAYVISNFVVCWNGGKFRCTDNKYKINFLNSTLLKDADETSIDLYGIRLVPFEDILLPSVDESLLVDVIGVLTGIGSVEPTYSFGKEGKRVTIELTDSKKSTLNCTLWDYYADQILTYAKNENNNAIVVLIQFAKIIKFNGTITVSNSKYTSRMFINQDIGEIIEFKNCLSVEADTSHRITHLSGSTSYSLAEDLLEKCERKSLDEIRDVRKECVCAVLATIVGIESEYGWFYNTCQHHNKKVQNEDGIFWCDECCNVVKFLVPRFKLRVRVMDDTSSTSFVLFDRDVQQLIGKTAPKLRTQLVEAGDSDSFPGDFECLLDKKFLFKIKITGFNLKQENSAYTVLKLTTDEDILKKFKRIDDDSQDSVEQLSESASQNFSTPTNTKTPIIIDEDKDEANQSSAVQMSTTKSVKRIKIEKLDQ